MMFSLPYGITYVVFSVLAGSESADIKKGTWDQPSFCTFAHRVGGGVELIILFVFDLSLVSHMPSAKKTTTQF